MSSEDKSKLSLEWLTKAIREKCPETKSAELVSFVTEPIVLNITNYTSDLEKIKIVFNDETKKKQINFSLVSKITRQMESQGGFDIWTNRVEVEIYVHVLTEMEKLMLEFKDHRDFYWPKLYGHVPHSIMVLEDVSQGEIPIPGTAWLNKGFAILGLKALGRFHAMSKILLHRGLVGEQFRNSYPLGKKTVFQKVLYSGMLQLLSDAMIEKKGHWKSVESSEAWGKRLQVLMPTVSDRRGEIYMNYDENYAVLNHGDFRTANIIFKGGKPDDSLTNIKFFDFQLSHVNSFSWDIIYFFALSVDPKCRKDCRDELLEAYQHSLKYNLTFFNYEGYIPTSDDVKNEVRRLAFPEFISTACSSPFVRTTSKNTVAFDKVLSHPPEEVINKHVYTEERYVNEIICDIERAIELGVI